VRCSTSRCRSCARTGSPRISNLDKLWRLRCGKTYPAAGVVVVGFGAVVAGGTTGAVVVGTPGGADPPEVVAAALVVEGNWPRQVVTATR